MNVRIAQLLAMLGGVLVSGCHGDQVALSRLDMPTVRLTVDTIVRDLPDDAGTIRDLAIDEAGGIYLLMNSAPYVRSFDDDGRPLQRFGGRGSGPGELRSPVRLTNDDSGRLWVTDFGRRKYAIYSPTGELVDERPLKARLSCHPTPCGQFLASGVHLEGEMRAVAHSVFVTNLFTDAGGERRDLFALPLIDSVPFEGIRPVTPFDRRMLWTVTPSGELWFTINADSVVRRRNLLTGDTMPNIIVSGRAPTEVTTDDAKAVQQEGLPGGVGLSFGALPHLKPTLAKMASGPAGDVWFALVDKGQTDSGSRFIVVGTKGTWVAELPTPLTFESVLFPATAVPLVIGNRKIYGLIVDDDGRQVVVRGSW